MSLSPAFLDELRARTNLSALIGGSLKLTKAGREYKACCPFHNEKTPSFTVVDDKQFYHCHGCGAHGDAIRWMTDYRGLSFLDAVKELADACGLDVPSPSPAAAARSAAIEGLRPALEAAQDYFFNQIVAKRSVGFYLQDRGISKELADRFGIGFAPEKPGYLRALGISQQTAIEAGLAWSNEGRSGERFLNRIMIPVHDARGRLVSFGGRDFAPSIAGPGRGQKSEAKYKNGSETILFDKGRTLFNLHRALPAARAKAGSTGRLIVVEGYFDVISLAGVGIEEAVAPMGTALTAEQLAMLWRIHVCPILMMDGDAAGRKAAYRAALLALPHVGAAGTLKIAFCPQGEDPDDIARKGGAKRVDAILSMAKELSEFLFDAVVDELDEKLGEGDPIAQASGPVRPPEAVSAIWHRLDELAQSIVDDETREQYLGFWRARFEREISLKRDPLGHLSLDVFTVSDDGEYVFPESENEAERRLSMIVKCTLELREYRREVSRSISDLRSMAKSIGFDGKALTAVCVMLEQDPQTRQEREAILALYRRVLGIKGPMLETMLPEALPVGVQPRRVAAAPGTAVALAWSDVS